MALNAIFPASFSGSNTPIRHMASLASFVNALKGIGTRLAAYGAWELPFVLRGIAARSSSSRSRALRALTAATSTFSWASWGFWLRRIVWTLCDLEPPRGVNPADRGRLHQCAR
ncbi:hypothetical protein PanWU01x14_139110 [Parasponia andersonii]|uniref:Uncharacterized protein n=1 Tax=Parasponia andersonii TaxID=3476 RepID=A0A2P5CN10_PARAD|nr:hypothetical protein PanWU01x14_139110 [Parasponia andersonii]